jgi:hypothetical protein
MAKCPKCGTEVSSPKKRWTMAGRPDKTGKMMPDRDRSFRLPKMQETIPSCLEQTKGLTSLREKK